MLIDWQNIPLIINTIASFAFVMLSVMAGFAWRGHRRGGLLIIAVALTAASASVAALSAAKSENGTLLLASFTQGLSGIAWLAFLYDLLRSEDEGRGELPWLKRWSFWAILTIGCTLILSHAVPLSGYVSALPWRQYNLVAQLGVGVLGLVLVEQLFRNAHDSKRWAVKYLCFGLGSLFAFDLFVFSEALLLGYVDQEIWEARGIVLLLLVPLLAITAARNRNWSVDVFVSRTAVAHSAALLGAGVYLMGVATTGYLIREYGGQWGTAIQIGFLFAALILLVSLFVSKQFRAHAKVFLAKHFFSHHYDYRDEWIRFVADLTTTDDIDISEKAIHAVGKFLDSPGGGLWKRNESGGLDLLSESGLGREGLSNFSQHDSIVHFLAASGWIIDLNEFREDPTTYPDLKIPSWLLRHQNAWLAVPLLLKDALWGLLILRQPMVRRSLNWEDHDLLKTAGQQVSSYLAFAEATERLVESRQFDAFNRLSAYVVHDLKNVAAQLSLVVTNSRQFGDNPEFRADALATVENATERMRHLLADLQKGPRAAKSDARIVAIDDAMESLLARTSITEPVPRLEMKADGLRIRAEPERFVSVLQHLIENAQQATPADGEVVVRVQEIDEWAVIEISDSGCGMDRAFIENRLFKPFDTTKGNAGMGIGAYESREFVKMSGGTITVKSKPGEGTRFTVRLPRLNSNSLAETE